MSISKVTTADTEKTSHHIWRNSDQLRGMVCVPQALDDGRQEQGDRVQRREDPNRYDAENPDFPVAKRVPQIMCTVPGRKQALVFFESTLDLVALRGSEKFSCVRVVMHEEKCGQS